MDSGAEYSKRLPRGDDVMSDAIVCQVGFPPMISKTSVWKRMWVSLKLETKLCKSCFVY